MKPYRYVLAEDLRVGDEIAIPEARVSIYKLTKVEYTEDVTVVFGGPYVIDRPAKPGMVRKDYFGSAQRQFELMHGRFQEVLLLHREDES
jgi:hypothetical protein